MKNYLLRVSLMGIFAMFWGIGFTQAQEPVELTWDYTEAKPAKP